MRSVEGDRSDNYCNSHDNALSPVAVTTESLELGQPRAPSIRTNARTALTEPTDPLLRVQMQLFPTGSSTNKFAPIAAIAAATSLLDSAFTARTPARRFARQTAVADCSVTSNPSVIGAVNCPANSSITAIRSMAAIRSTDKGSRVSKLNKVVVENFLFPLVRRRVAFDWPPLPPRSCDTTIRRFSPAANPARPA